MSGKREQSWMAPRLAGWTLEGAAGAPAGRAVGRGGGGRHTRGRARRMHVPRSLPRAQKISEGGFGRDDG